MIRHDISSGGFITLPVLAAIHINIDLNSLHVRTLQWLVITYNLIGSGIYFFQQTLYTCACYRNKSWLPKFVFNICLLPRLFTGYILAVTYG